MSKIYDKNGWVNWDFLATKNRAFMMVIGARGIGKTYGLISHLIETRTKFIYLRRLQTQLDACAAPDGNPFQAWNTGTNTETPVRPFKQGKQIAFDYTQYDSERKTYVSTGNTAAYGIALSTMATIRGADFSGYDAILFDEFIAMDNERPIKNEFQAFLNFYETVNRNREIQGKQPVKCYMLGNANRLSNPYLIGWKMMGSALRMIRGDQMISYSKNVTLVMLLRSPISDKKRHTVLYTAANAEYEKMALDNAFRTDETKIKQRRLTDYEHVCSVGEIGIYHRRGGGDYYVCRKTQQTEYYEPYGIYLMVFRRSYIMLREIYFVGKIVFESYECEMIFREMLGIA